MRSLILLFCLLPLLAGCGTIRTHHKNCQPSVTQEVSDAWELIKNPETDWTCDEPWYRR